MRLMQSVLGLGELTSVSLVTDRPLDGVAEFYQSFGLEVLEEWSSDDRLVFRANGDAHHVLTIRTGEHRGLDNLTFSLHSRDAVDRLFEQYSASDVTCTSEPGLLDGPAGGYGFGFVDHEGRRFTVATETTAADPRPPGLPLPRRVTHVVLNTTDIDEACSFYTERLGFRVSDWSEHQMVFLRCGTDHHTIAFNQDEHASVNHIAYEVVTLDDFLTSVGRMKRAGIEPLWGIGRHGPGHNSFAYYGDPAGFVPEFTSEVAQVDEDTWQPRVWRRIPAQSDLWGTAGPPPAELRTAMRGVPDPGLSRP